MPIASMRVKIMVENRKLSNVAEHDADDNDDTDTPPGNRDDEFTANWQQSGQTVANYGKRICQF